MQTRQSKSANHSLPDAGNVRKRPVPTARKDEWQDSSDEGEGNNATVPNLKGSRYFSLGMTNSPPKKRLVTSKGPRFNKIYKPKGAEAKKPSQSIDFRNRREAEESYRKKVCALIDDDILQRVDAEGGITPVGRMYKAICRMMERQSKSKQPGANGASHDEVMRLRAENQAMREKIDEATQLLRSA
ncbi:hypothetical protein AYO22_08795 [Fonsecaea multimorphosa]|nr:hypothetical protein AYO22_08795 [Fonsecaea multimorphosa]